MNKISVNFENLTEKERETLLQIVEKANKSMKLSDIKNGDTFKIGDVTYIKFFDVDGVTTAVTKDILYKTKFGKNNNLKESEVCGKLINEFLPRVAELIGDKNICEFTTDLTSLDGLNPYGTMTSKISLPTFDFYRANVKIFDEYKVNEYWWLATSDTVLSHGNADWVVCVSPRGYVSFNYCYCYNGVRPVLQFVSSISVSYEG